MYGINPFREEKPLQENVEHANLPTMRPSDSFIVPDFDRSDAPVNLLINRYYIVDAQDQPIEGENNIGYMEVSDAYAKINHSMIEKQPLVGESIFVKQWIGSGWGPHKPDYGMPMPKTTSVATEERGYDDSGVPLEDNILDLVEERTVNDNAASLIDRATGACMEVWYGLTKTFNSNPDKFDPAPVNPSDKFIHFKLAPGGDAREEAYRKIIDQVDNLCVKLNKALGRSLFSSEIMKKDGQFKVAAKYAEGNGGIFHAASKEGDVSVIIQMSMPRQNVIRDAFKSLLTTPEFPIGNEEEIPDAESVVPQRPDEPQQAAPEQAPAPQEQPPIDDAPLSSGDGMDASGVPASEKEVGRDDPRRFRGESVENLEEGKSPAGPRNNPSMIAQNLDHEAFEQVRMWSQEYNIPFTGKRGYYIVVNDGSTRAGKAMGASGLGVDGGKAAWLPILGPFKDKNQANSVLPRIQKWYKADQGRNSVVHMGNKSVEVPSFSAGDIVDMVTLRFWDAKDRNPKWHKWAPIQVSANEYDPDNNPFAPKPQVNDEAPLSSGDEPVAVNDNEIPDEEELQDAGKKVVKDRRGQSWVVNINVGNENEVENEGYSFKGSFLAPMVREFAETDRFNDTAPALGYEGLIGHPVAMFDEAHFPITNVLKDEGLGQVVAVVREHTSDTVLNHLRKTVSSVAGQFKKKAKGQENSGGMTEYFMRVLDFLAQVTPLQGDFDPISDYYQRKQANSDEVDVKSHRAQEAIAEMEEELGGEVSRESVMIHSKVEAKTINPLFAVFNFQSKFYAGDLVQMGPFLVAVNCFAISDDMYTKLKELGDVSEEGRLLEIEFEINRRRANDELRRAQNENAIKAKKEEAKAAVAEYESMKKIADIFEKVEQKIAEEMAKEKASQKKNSADRDIERQHALDMSVSKWQKSFLSMGATTQQAVRDVLKILNDLIWEKMIKGGTTFVFKKLIGGTISTVGGVADNVGDWLTDAASRVGQEGAAWAKSGSALAQGGSELLRNMITMIIERARYGTGTLVTEIWDNIRDAWGSDVWPMIKEVLGAARRAFSETIRFIFGGLFRAIASLFKIANIKLDKALSNAEKDALKAESVSLSSSLDDLSTPITEHRFFNYEGEVHPDDVDEYASFLIDLSEEVAANAVAHGGVDFAPDAKKKKAKEFASMVTRWEKAGRNESTRLSMSGGLFNG